MKKIISFSFALTMLFTLSFAKSNTNVADKIIGVYWSPKKDAKIEIYKKATCISVNLYGLQQNVKT
jgi:hypothetical protein